MRCARCLPEYLNCQIDHARELIVQNYPEFVKMQKCENVRRYLAKFLNAERWFFYWIQKVQKYVHLGISRQELSNAYLLIACKFWRRYSRERASQSLPKISQKLEKKS